MSSGSTAILFDGQGGKPEGVCFASLATIADICKISERKTQQVLKFLVEAGMITKEKNPGRKTDEYRVTHASSWVPKKQLDELRHHAKKRKSEESQSSVLAIGSDDRKNEA
jgi:DNA-binding transcriptional regulator GbsR (MarR family)